MSEGAKMQPVASCQECKTVRYIQAGRKHHIRKRYMFDLLNRQRTCLQKITMPESGYIT